MFIRPARLTVFLVCAAVLAAGFPAGGQTDNVRGAPLFPAGETVCGWENPGLTVQPAAGEEGGNLDFGVTVENWRGHVDFIVWPGSAGEGAYRLVNEELWFEALDGSQTRTVRVEASLDGEAGEGLEVFTLEAAFRQDPGSSPLFEGLTAGAEGRISERGAGGVRPGSSAVSVRPSPPPAGGGSSSLPSRSPGRR